MPDRSTFLRVALASVLAALAVSSTASAAVTVPTGAPVVAGPTAHGGTLTAFLKGDKLCTAVRQPDPPADERQYAGPIGPDEPACDEIPVLGPFAQAPSFSWGTTATPSRAMDAGAVGADVAAIQWRLKGKVLGHADTQASPLPGPAGDLRFFAIEGDLTQRPDEVVLLDATGTVRRAADWGVQGSGGQAHGIRITTRRVVQRGRTGAARWTLRSWIEHPIASTPLQPERRIAVPCVAMVWAGPGHPLDRADGESACMPEQFTGAQRLDLGGEECGAIGRWAGGIVQPGVRRLVAVLGDGARRTIPLAPIPGVHGGLRAGITVLGNGVALRRLVALGAGGRVLDQEPWAAAPKRPEKCTGGYLGGVSLYDYGFGLSRRRLGAGPHAPVVTDAGALVCLAIDGAPKVPDDCAPAPLDAQQSSLSAQPTADGRYVAGLVTPEITSARVRLDDGTARDVAATPIPGYGGQYAQVLKIVAVDVPGRRRVIGYDLRDARGRVLQSADGQPELPRLEQRRTLLRTPGLPPLGVAVLPKVRDLGPVGCLTLGPVTSDDAPSSCGFASPGYFTVLARCEERRILLYGVLGRPSDRLSVRLADGREVPARAAALPRDAAHGGTAALVVLGGRDAPRKLVRRRGGKVATSALVLPPAAEQCGYRRSAGIGNVIFGI
jgi:hypothetical protein